MDVARSARLSRVLAELDKKYERLEVPDGAIKLLVPSAGWTKATHAREQMRDFRDEMQESQMRAGSFRFVKVINALNLVYDEDDSDDGLTWQYSDIENELWDTHYLAPDEMDEEGVVYVLVLSKES